MNVRRHHRVEGGRVQRGWSRCKQTLLANVHGKEVEFLEYQDHMALLDQLQKDLVAAMKAKEELKLGTVRMIKTALQKAQVADPSKPLTEAVEQQLLKSLVKQRTDAAEMFRKGGREELAVKEEAERVIIESYLPASASEEEIEAAVADALAETGATSAKQMGLVIVPRRRNLSARLWTGNLSARK